MASRRHEIGILVALGASSRNVVRLMVWRGVFLVAAGLALGVAGATGATRLLRQQLFGVSATDPTTFAIVGISFTMFGVLACLIPARRAARVDPEPALPTSSWRAATHHAPARVPAAPPAKAAVSRGD